MKRKIIGGYLLLAGVFAFILSSCSDGETIYEHTIDRPIDVRATQGDFVDMIVVAWDADPIAKIFEVYRMNDETKEYELIGKTGHKYFVDHDVEQTHSNYYYKVRVYNSKKLHSDYSDICSGYLDQFLSVQGFDVVDGDNLDHIYMEWPEVKGADSYEVHRSVDDTLNFQKLIETKSNHHYDRKVDVLTKYYYKLRAVNMKLGKTKFSGIDSSYIYEQYEYLETIGERGYDTGQFSWPYGILFDAQDNFYVSETSANRIQKFKANGDFIKVFAHMSVPRGMEWFINGNMLIGESDVSRMVEYDLNGNRIDYWNNSFRYFREIDVDKAGNIYVTDSDNDRVQKFDKDKNFIRMWGGEGTGDTQFDFPWGLEVFNDVVYVGDGNFVRLFTLDGEFIEKWDFETPVYYITAHKGHLYISCRNYVLKTDEEGNILSKIGMGKLEMPQGIGFHSDGRMYVVDTGTHDVRIFRNLSE
ncbi:hypothetical protein [Marinifilum caeruleilacunae]|uniref:6-bladed beta-propeller n=1 Tax=Marinifilum caeruleilacunae TaxID=2499076 RepID=A0ABX1WYF5_9BACT|nr:hypothetical protein [Marinifilum caeruleilacunae]NOU60946.1 hypothetical protein [Marinifilum caeruleilacunae]